MVVLVCVLLSTVCGIVLIWNSSCSLIWFASGKLWCAEEQSHSAPVKQLPTQGTIFMQSHDKELAFEGEGNGMKGQGELAAERPEVDTLEQCNNSKYCKEIVTVMSITVNITEKQGNKDSTYIEEDDDSDVREVVSENGRLEDKKELNIFMALAGLLMILSSIISCSCLLK